MEEFYGRLITLSGLTPDDGHDWDAITADTTS